MRRGPAFQAVAMDQEHKPYDFAFVGGWERKRTKRITLDFADDSLPLSSRMTSDFLELLDE
jgi:hypothetical protein